MAESVQTDQKPNGFLKEGTLVNDGELRLDDGAIAVKREGWAREIQVPRARIRYWVLA